MGTPQQQGKHFPWREERGSWWVWENHHCPAFNMKTGSGKSPQLVPTHTIVLGTSGLPLIFSDTKVLLWQRNRWHS
jgi:hypothetical protein